MNERKVDLSKNRFAKASLASRILFRPMSHLLKKGYRNDLNEEDLYEPLVTDKAEMLTEELYSETLRKKKSLFLILARLCFFQFIKLSLIITFEESLRIGLPVLIGEVLKYFEKDGIDFWLAFAYSTVFVIGIFVAAFCHHFYFYRMIQEGVRIKTACIGLIYKRCFNLKLTDLGENNGKITNLLNTESSNIELMIKNMPYFVLAPTETLFVVWFLTQKVDVRFLAGVIFLLCFIPFQLFFGWLIGIVRNKLTNTSDSRVGLMDEILNGIGVIKMYCWEIPFKKRIERIRRNELKYQTGIHIITAIGSSIENDFYTIVTFLSVLFLFLFTEIPLKPEYVVYAIGFYSRLGIVLGAFFNKAIIDTIHGLVSLRRIDKFLNVDMMESIERRIYNSPRIKLNNLTANWDGNNNKKNQNQFTLENITFEIKEPWLVAVVGKVGSGKSSLLLAILNEMNKQTGNVIVDGTVSYVNQEPWIFPATIEQNILFGNEYDREKLDRVLRQCCLYEELKNKKLFPNGLKTYVAEKGINLSGGQRARVGLARALYNDSQIYLFDDPLSAVDAAVARTLYSCIKNYLSDKIRILVTHQSSHLSDANLIIIMENGKIVEIDTYQKLSQDEKYKSYLSAATRDSNDTVLDNEFVDESELQLANMPCCSNDFRRKMMITHSQDPNSNEIEKMSVSLSKNDLYLVDPLLSSDENEESVNEGAIKMNTYLDFLGRNGSLLFGLFSVFLFGFTQFFIVLADLYISKWATYEEEMHWQGAFYTGGLNSTRLNHTQFANGSAFEMERKMTTIWNRVDHHLFAQTDRTQKLIIYAVIITFAFAMMIFRSFIYYTFCIITSFKYHKHLLNSIISTSMDFFEMNPTGRISNRFTRDIRAVDDTLALTLFEFLQTFVMVAGIVILASIINYWMIFIIIPLCILCWCIRRYSLRSSTHLKRLEGKYKSPILDHMKNTLRGMSTIRACKKEKLLEEEFFYHADLSTSTTLAYEGSQRWFRLRLDLVAGFYSMAAIFFCLFGKSYLSINPANIGLLLTYILNFASTFQWMVCQSCVVENLMTSVERLVEYIEQKSEPYNKGKAASEDWPREGKIEFKDVSLEFGETKALNGLKFEIRGGQKIGIIGRTGAGKTSIVKLLFRMCNVSSGTILIDGKDTNSIKLTDLRRKLAIIPQEPILFESTIRFNLDPLYEYTNEKIISVLNAVQLGGLKDGFDHEVKKGGANLAAGQKQLVCLARAVLKGSKIVLIDEATANIDHSTDEKVQKVMESNFKDSTVLTIAHRLDNVAKSDLIMCMKSGEMDDFDTPLNLLNKSDSIFSNLVQHLPEAKQEEIRKIVYNRHSS